MPNAYSENIAWQINAGRREHGVPVILRGETEHRVTTETVSGANCGMDGLPKEIKQGLQAYTASLDPRVFRFCPDEFEPVTSLPAPTEQDTLTWHTLVYLITRVNFDDTSDDTHGINCYALRKIF